MGKTGKAKAVEGKAPEIDRSLSRRWVIGIFVLAFLYRWLVFSFIGDHPLFRFPVVDAGYHSDWAERIVRGDFFGQGAQDVFKPPLYAYFLALGDALSPMNIGLIQWVQYLLGALSCVMAAILAARLLGRRVGQVAGILGAVYAPYAFFESQLLTPALSIFLDLAAILVLVPEGRAPSNRRMLAGGLLFGLSAGVRPDVLAPAGLLVLYILWRYRADSWRSTVGRAVCAGAGVLVMILPITIRNAVITHNFIPIAGNDGINFYVGNSTRGDGVSDVPLGLKWERLIAELPEPIREQPVLASSYWKAKAWKEIAADPYRMVRRLGKKALAFLNRKEFRNNICYHFMQALAWPLRLPFLQYSVILPLALCGIVLLFFRRRDPARRAALPPILIWIGGFWLVGIIFFVTDRYRITAVPLMTIAAAWALVELASAVRLKQWRTMGIGAASILAAGALCWPMWFGRPETWWAFDYLNLGNALGKAGDMAGSEKAYRQALEVSDDPDAHFILGLILLAKDRNYEGVRHLEAALKGVPDSPDILMSLARTYSAAGNPERARGYLYRILNLSKPATTWMQATAHIMLAEMEPSAAEEHWKKAWEIDAMAAADEAFRRKRDLPKVVEAFGAPAKSKPGDPYAQGNYGMALLEAGRAEEALAPLRIAVKLAPQEPNLAFYLARALAQSGRRTEAIPMLQRLLDRLPESPLRRDAEMLYGRLTGTGG